MQETIDSRKKIDERLLLFGAITSFVDHANALDRIECPPRIRRSENSTG